MPSAEQEIMNGQANGDGQIQYSPEELETLNQLVDIALPEPIGFWPPSIQACAFGLIFIVLALLLAHKLRTNKAQNQYRKTAMSHLIDIKSRSQVLSANAYVAEINTLLKRCALSAGADRSEINALNGGALYSYLANTDCKVKVKTSTSFSAYAKHYLHWQELAYAPGKDNKGTHLQALNEFAEMFIALHKYPISRKNINTAGAQGSSAVHEAKSL